MSCTRSNRPAFYEVWEDSDYECADYTTPLTIAAIVVLVSLVVYCMCKRAMRRSCGACASARVARASSADGPVAVRDEAHLDQLIADGCVCLFYAPWCGHCNEMKPEFIEAAKESPDVVHAMCDCENAVGQAALEKHSIQGFPTVRYYANGRLVDEHEGPRTKDAFVSWTKDHSSRV